MLGWGGFMPAAVRPARFQYFIFDNVERKFVKIHDGFLCGRNEGDLQFPSDDVISRKQCRFTISANDVYLEDMGSTNRTKVNTVPLNSGKRRRMQINDVIEFGRRRFILTNQDKHEPSNLVDPSKKAVYKAIRKSDGSLTSQISRLITTQTKVLLDRRTYSKLRVREFTQLRGWDVSTVLTLIGLVAFWVASTALFVARGAFTPGLVHPPEMILIRLAFVAVPWSGFLTLVHYLGIRKRYKKLAPRLVFVPVWILATLLAMPMIDGMTSIVEDATDNVVELHCVRTFSPDACRPWAREDTPGFSRLPRDLQDAIFTRLRIAAQGKGVTPSDSR
jgi:pSer/pThr/pTyr-binding forkhead associated (FHA) protein